jgi:hypothetical protein
MNISILLVSGLVSGALMLAGLAKLRAPAEFAETLAQLRVPRGLRRVTRYAVPGAELAVAAGLLVLPGAYLPIAGLAGLGTAFAVAGALALRADRPVRCSCFGATGGTLGLRQVLLLPLWLAAAYVLYRGGPQWNAATGLELLAALVVVLGAANAGRVVLAWRAAAATRTAMEEAILVRPPMLTPVESSEVDAA